MNFIQSPSILLKGLLRDKGGVDYSTLSMSALRKRLDELEMLEEKILNEMKLIVNTVEELFEPPRLIGLPLKNKTHMNLTWRISVDGNRRAEVTYLFSNNNNACTRALSLLSNRMIQVLFDLDNRKRYLDNAFLLLKQEIKIYTKYIEDSMRSEDVFNHLAMNSFEGIKMSQIA